MLQIATWAQASPGLALGAVAYFVAGLLFYALGRATRDLGPVGRFACRLGQLALGLLALCGLPLMWIVLAAIGCPPDAYECPV
jgi:hypothetical protein